MPNYPRLLFLLLLILNQLFSADLRPKDVFFISSFGSPKFITGDYRRAYIVGQKHIMVYDHLKNRWSASLPVSQDVLNVFFSKERGKFRILTPSGPMEYSEAFQDFSPIDSLNYSLGGDTSRRETEPVERLSGLNGIGMPYPWFYTQGQIRDKYMRRASVTQAAVFDYDILWVLTNGLGLFKGSHRRLHLEPVWQGLEDTDVKALCIYEDKIYFGASGASGSLVQSNLDLQQWQRYPAGSEPGFPNAAINDIIFWKGYLWLATEDGVIRYHPQKGHFVRFGYFKGLRAERALCLIGTDSLLYVGTERGLAVKNISNSEFMLLPHPEILTLPVYTLSKSENGVWAGTKYGLFLCNNGLWQQPGSTHLTKGLAVNGVLKVGKKLYWSQDDRLLVQDGDKGPSEVLSKTGIKRLKKQKNYIFGTFAQGVFVYNIKTGISVDFPLNNYIIGDKVNTFALSKNYLWVATNQGVTRVHGSKYYP